MKRETVGKISSDLISKSTENTHSACEQSAEHLKGYLPNMEECITQMKKTWPQRDFYVVVITKKERIMQNVIRNYFFGRLSCPTPDYDQTVYFFKSGDESLDFLWVIPARDACMDMIRHATLILPEEMSLLKFVLDFRDGSLFRLAQYRNGELGDI